MLFETADTESYCRLMVESFQGFTGQRLTDERDVAQGIWRAPQPIISHGIEADPIFRYGNAAALTLWEMDWAGFTRLPSRLSAEPDDAAQEERNALLRAAMSGGYVDGLCGVRVSASGRRFEIRDTVLWNVVDAAGVQHGQAALIRDWRYL